MKKGFKMIEIGDSVEKIRGYKYPGIVVAKFNKLDSIEERFVVECTAPATAGMLHIFHEDQLKKIEDTDVADVHLRRYRFRGCI